MINGRHTEFIPHQNLHDCLCAEMCVDEHFTAVVIAFCLFHFPVKLIWEGDTLCESKGSPLCGMTPGSAT